MVIIKQQMFCRTQIIILKEGPETVETLKEKNTIERANQGSDSG
jgi:hypothetical protein